MTPHPRYQGAVVDAHCHVDGTHRDEATATLDEVGVNCWLNLWNLDWPPPSFQRWRAEIGDRAPAGLGLGHAPDLSRVGAEDFTTEIEASIRTAADEGAVALKIWKNLGLTLRDVRGDLIAVDDSRLDVVWRAAAETDLPVVIHVADPVAFFAPLNAHNERLAELEAHPDWWFGGGENPSFLELISQLDTVLGRHVHTTFIGAHMGCYAEDLGRVGEMLDAHENYFVDTSARVAEIGRNDPDRVREFFLRYSDRILFGSDFCRTRELMLPESAGREAEEEFFARYWRFFETDEAELEHPIPIQGNWKVRGIQLPDAALKKLYRDNAERLLPRLTAGLIESENR